MNTEQNPPTPTTLPAVVTPEQFIENGLAKFEITTESLEEFRSQYSDLLTKEVTNKKELEEVHKAQMAYVKKRGEITTKGKDIRSMANAFSKAVIAREDEYIAIISPDEITFKKKKDDYNEKIRLQEEEDDRKEKLRIQDMLDKLNAVECVIDYSTLISMDDTQFNEYLASAAADFEVIVSKREEQRLADEQRLREEEAARKAEGERLEKIRIEQEAQQKKFDEEQAAFREEQERIRIFNEGVANKLREAEVKLEEEKRAIQEAKNAEIAEKNRQAEIARAAEEAAAKAIEEEALRKKHEKEEQEQALQFGEDSHRFSFLAQQIEVSFINSAVWSHMKSKKGKEAGYTVLQLIREAYKLCSVHASKVKTGVPMESDTKGD